MNVTTRLSAVAVGAALAILPASALAATQQGAQSAAAAHAQRIAGTVVNWQVRLRAGRAVPRATGSSQYQAQPGQREVQVEVEHLGSLAGRSLLVRVNGARFGSMKVSASGIAQLTRNTELGHKVPPIGHGSTVSVYTPTGVLVASGSF